MTQPPPITQHRPADYARPPCSALLRPVRLSVDLSLPEAAALLGQSLHQVRYLIRTARLPAKKVGGQWRVRREDLPRGEAQAQAAERKVERLREAVDDALALPPSKVRYSLRDMKAFAVARPLCLEAARSLQRGDMLMKSERTTSSRSGGP